MKKVTKLLFFMTLVSLSALFMACNSDSSNNDSNIPMDFCTTAEDCIPNKCCHPDGAINKQYEPECETQFCTLSCETLLDCGNGHIECIENRCTVVANE